MKILELQGPDAVVELGGVKRRVDVSLLESTRLGDYVIVHAGFAISTVNEEEAQRTLELFAEIDATPDRP